MVLDELSLTIVSTLISELGAVTDKGQIDHKSRLTALREARNFLQQILPTLSKEAKEEFSKTMTEEFSKKLDFIKEQEAKLDALNHPAPSTSVTGGSEVSSPLQPSSLPEPVSPSGND